MWSFLTERSQTGEIRDTDESVAVRFFCLFESGLLSFKGGGFENIMKFLKPMQ